MSKKSRKRNKKILTILGLAAAATAASRRNKGTAADANDGFRTKSNKSVSAGGGQTYAPTPKVVLPKTKIQSKPPTLYRPNPKTLASPKWNNWADDSAPDGSGNYVTPRSRSKGYSRDGATGLDDAYAAKDGGRATYKSGGAAKRGISPILMKGKK
jgi:hypothetical protein